MFLTTRPYCLPKCSGDMPFSQHLLGSLFLLSALGPQGSILFKKLGSLQSLSVHSTPRTSQTLPHVITTAQGERELSSPFPDEKKNQGFHAFPPLPNHSLGDMDYNVVFYFMNIATIAWTSFILFLEIQASTL